MPPELPDDHLAWRALFEAKVNYIQDDLNDLKELRKLKTEIAVLKVKVAMFGTAAGLFAGIGGSVVTGVVLKWLGS